MNFKYLGLALLSTLSLSSCDPMAEVYDEIDAQGPTYISKTCEEYVLTADDYAKVSAAAVKAAGEDAQKLAAAKAIKTELAFSADAPASELLPSFVKTLFPSWQQGSVVNLTYDYSSGQTELEKKYSTIESYKVKAEDYTAITGGDEYFSPSYPAADHVSEILIAAYPDAEANTGVVVEYNYSETQVTIPQVALESPDFSEQEVDQPLALEGWKNIALGLDKKWICKEYSSVRYVQMSAYKAGGAVDSWLISPLVTVTDDMFLNFDFKYGYYTNGKGLEVFVSESYDGSENIDPAQWTSIDSKINYPTEYVGGYSDWHSLQADLATYAGKKIYIAFRYVGSSEDASPVTTTVQLNNITVAQEAKEQEGEEQSPVTKVLEAYSFDGKAWATQADVITIQAADYDAMGDPGKYDNFSTSAQPANYIPVFLASKYPYAEEGDVKAMIYKYYDKINQILIDEYIYTDGQWSINENRQVVSKETYICTKDGWIFDPTILHEVSNADYISLIDWVKTNKPAYMDPQYDNTEYWFGGSSHYNNFNIQLVKRRSYDAEGVLEGLSDEEAELYLDTQIVEAAKVILGIHYADVDPEHASGAAQQINISAKVYDSNNYRYTMIFNVLGDGVFELDGEIIKTDW